MDEATLASIHAALVEHARLIDEVKAECREKCESLERKCGVLEARCDSLERSIQVLKKDVDWTYSAPGIPRSHWIEQGHGEDYAGKMEQLLCSIKENAEGMRKGDHHNCNCLYKVGGQTTSHDDALLPHFEELADAIQVSSGIGYVLMANIELSPTAINILFPAMEGKVTMIHIESKVFPAEDVVECYERIATSIRRNYSLKVLRLDSNRFPSYEQADLLIESIKDNRSIKQVQMQNCFNENSVNGCRALASLLTSGRPFEWLNFDRNGLSGIDDVTAALATNSQIRVLGMSGNELSDRDAELIAQALKQNTNLQNLYLSRNYITAAGFETIQAVIYNPSSLNAMEACNHTCWIDCMERNDDYEGGNDSGLTPQQRRRRKLYKMLSTRHVEGSNAFHLDAELSGEPGIIKLVPRVLERVQQCSVDRSADSSLPLSLHFELMKSWKMPELYEHRLCI